jgi:steroid delta-isomerase-like uncharacterized protein
MSEEERAMSEQHKATARRALEEIESGGDIEALTEVFTPDCRNHDPVNDEDTVGYEAYSEEISTYRAAFPDLRYTVEDQLAEGDLVASRWTVRGTHRGELMGIAPTGKEIELRGITIHRFAEGKIAEEWWNWDALGLMQQLGAIPAEQPA